MRAGPWQHLIGERIVAIGDAANVLQFAKEAVDEQA
jgi:hypothetical protein